MRKLIYSMNVSLDGFIAGPNGELDWANVDEELHRHFNEHDRQAGGHLYGRLTYQVMADYWPTAEANPEITPIEREYAQIWNNLPKVVFSRTLTQVGEKTRLVREIIAEEVEKLKAQPGGDLYVAGADLAATFMRLALIDEYQLYIHPVVIGQGRRFFKELENPLQLQLLETHTFSSGVVLLRYQPAKED